MECALRVRNTAALAFFVSAGLLDPARVPKDVALSLPSLLTPEGVEVCDVCNVCNVCNVYNVYNVCNVCIVCNVCDV